MGPNQTRCNKMTSKNVLHVIFVVVVLTSLVRSKKQQDTTWHHAGKPCPLWNLIGSSELYISLGLILSRHASVFELVVLRLVRTQCQWICLIIFTVAEWLSANSWNNAKLLCSIMYLFAFSGQCAINQLSLSWDHSYSIRVVLSWYLDFIYSLHIYCAQYYGHKLNQPETFSLF